MSRKAGVEDLLLRLCKIVGEAPEMDGVLNGVVDAIGGARIAIARLPDGADIDEVFVAEDQSKINGIVAIDESGVHFENCGNVGMTVEAELGMLVGEGRLGFDGFEHISPVFGSIEGGMHDGNAPDNCRVWEFAKPIEIFRRDLLTRPFDHLCGERMEIVRILGIGGGIVIVVSANGDAPEISDDIAALIGAGVVSDNVANADIICDPKRFCVVEDDVQRFEIGVNISDDGNQLIHDGGDV